MHLNWFSITIRLKESILDQIKSVWKGNLVRKEISILSAESTGYYNNNYNRSCKPACVINLTEIKKDTNNVSIINPAGWHLDKNGARLSKDNANPVTSVTWEKNVKPVVDRRTGWGNCGSHLGWGFDTIGLSVCIKVCNPKPRGETGLYQVNMRTREKNFPAQAIWLVYGGRKLRHPSPAPRQSWRFNNPTDECHYLPCPRSNLLFLLFQSE